MFASIFSAIFILNTLINEIVFKIITVFYRRYFIMSSRVMILISIINILIFQI